MKKLTAKQLEDLLLTRAMADYVHKEERFESLNDVIDEVFADGALNREDYLHSIMQLTQFGYVISDIESEEDIEMSEAVGYDIKGLTPKAIEYVSDLENDKAAGEKVKSFFIKFYEMCDKLANSGTVNLAGKLIIPVLKLLV